MSKLSVLLGWLMCSSFVIPAIAAEVEYIDIKELPNASHYLIGKRISTHGCLIWNLHGDFIEPCENTDWRKITLIYDPSYKLILDAYKKLKPGTGDLEADAIGVIVEMPSDSRSGKSIFLRLESLSGIKRHEP